jgi:cytochrome c-type biogenesis protein CcmF
MYFHPFVRWIWGGALIMFLGGLLSLSDRRLRIGMPSFARRAGRSAVVPAE